MRTTSEEQDQDSAGNGRGSPSADLRCPPAPVTFVRERVEPESPRVAHALIVPHRLEMQAQQMRLCHTAAKRTPYPAAIGCGAPRDFALVRTAWSRDGRPT